MPHRTLTLLGASLALVVALAGCGVEAVGDRTAAIGPAGEADRTTTTEAEPLPVPNGAVGQMVDLYVDMGFDRQQARCLSEGMIEDYGSVDMERMLDLMEGCDISMADMQAMSEQLGVTDPDDGIRTGLALALDHLGLSEDQQGCVIDAYLDEHGPDLLPMQDPAVLLGLLDGCDVSPGDLRPGS